MIKKELNDVRYRFYSTDFEIIMNRAIQSFDDIKKNDYEARES